MGQTSFLELNHIDVGDHFAKDTIFVDVIDNGLLLHAEHLGAKIGTVGGSLTWE